SDARLPHGADACDGHQRQRRARRRRPGRADADRARSDEDGAARPRSRGRPRTRRALPRRRPGAAGRQPDRFRMNLPARVRIVEVGPRDGLQNESARIETADKIAFVDRLSDAGHTVIEVSAFVSPKWVPQMADAVTVFAGIVRCLGLRCSALLPNEAGLARAVKAGVDEVAIFAAASESFS